MKTEFNDPNDSLDDGVPIFRSKTVGETRLDPIVRIEVYPAIGKIELAGIFGNRYISTETAQEVVDEIQRAIDFVDENRSL